MLAMNIINGHIAYVLINTNPLWIMEKKLSNVKKKKKNPYKPHNKKTKAFSDSIYMLLSKVSLAGGCVPSKPHHHLLSIRKQQPEKNDTQSSAKH